MKAKTTKTETTATGNTITVKLDCGFWVASEADSKGSVIWACSRRSRGAAVRAVKAREKANP